jgi:hypothetical protein
MKKSVVVIEARREAYSKGEAARGTMSVLELINLLEHYDDDALVVFSHDNGYSYGGVNESDIKSCHINTEED